MPKGSSEILHTPAQQKAERASQKPKNKQEEPDQAPKRSRKKPGEKKGGQSPATAESDIANALANAPAVTFSQESPAMSRTVEKSAVEPKPVQKLRLILLSSLGLSGAIAFLCFAARLIPVEAQQPAKDKAALAIPIGAPQTRELAGGKKGIEVPSVYIGNGDLPDLSHLFSPTLPDGTTVCFDFASTRLLIVQPVDGDPTLLLENAGLYAFPPVDMSVAEVMGRIAPNGGRMVFYSGGKPFYAVNLTTGEIQGIDGLTQAKALSYVVRATSPDFEPLFAQVQAR